MAGDTIDDSNEKNARKRNSPSRILQYLSEKQNSSEDDSPSPNRSPTKSIIRSATLLLGRHKLTEEMAKDNKKPTTPWFDVVAFFFLGMSGWWVYSALYVEAPIFVQCENETMSSSDEMADLRNSTNKLRCTLPEGNNITNQMNVLGQFGNAFPFAYRLLGRFCGPRRIRLPVVIGVWLAIGCASAVVAAIFWQTSVHLFGTVDSSVPLLAATLFSGGLGCMSSMTYWQFAADFDISHTKALSVGMATGGLFPAIMSVAQNTGTDMTASSNFSPRVQMFIAAGVQVFFILVFCRIAFLYYHIQPVLHKADRPDKSKNHQPEGTGGTEGGVGAKKELISPLLDHDSESIRIAQLLEGDEGEGGESEGEGDESDEGDDGIDAQPCCDAEPFTYIPYTVIFVLYACTYALPSLVSYMIKNYVTPSPKSIYTFINLGYTLGDVLGRVAATSMSCVPNWTTLISMSVVVIALFVFQLFAAMSNKFFDCTFMPHNWGFAFVGLQFTYYALRGFIVTNMYVRVKTDYVKSRHSAVTARMSTVGQVGSFLGTLIPFLLLTVFKVVPSHPEFCTT